MDAPRQWLDVSVRIKGKLAQASAEAVLKELGALAITFSQASGKPVLEPLPGETPQWEDATVIGLFDDAAIPELIQMGILSALEDFDPANLSLAWRGEKDYVTQWQQSLKPLQINDRLWISPDGSEPEGAGGVTLKLAPGLAFGSGEHATTWMCLEWLSKQNLAEKCVVDYGCGSGILGIAAALMGAIHVHCIDYDPQALVATKENAITNAVLDRISIHAPADIPDMQCDVLVANIVLGPLLELQGPFRKLLVPGGPIALTGVLAEQTARLENAYRRDFDGFEIESRGDWRMLTARRRVH